MTACKTGIYLLAWVCVLLISSGSVGKNLYLARAAGSCALLYVQSSYCFFLLIILLESFSVFYCENLQFTRLLISVYWFERPVQEKILPPFQVLTCLLVHQKVKLMLTIISCMHFKPYLMLEAINKRVYFRTFIVITDTRTCLLIMDCSSSCIRFVSPSLPFLDNIRMFCYWPFLVLLSVAF